MPAPIEPPGDPLAWEPRDLVGRPIQGCCGEAWVGVGVSPPFGSPEQPLADGSYFYTVDRWDPVPGEAALEAMLEIQRFEACARDEGRGGDLLLGCNPEWPDDAVEVDLSDADQRPLRIDEDVLVAYTGGLVCDVGPEGPYVTTGAGYAVMIEQLGTDYEEWIGRFLRDGNLGVDVNGIREQLRTDPASPFVLDPCEGLGSGDVLWTSPEGVPVMLQGAASDFASPLDAWELIREEAMQVIDGHVVLYTSGAWRS